MSTASFDRNFDVRDSQSALRLHEDLCSPKSVKAAERDPASEDEKGVQLLKQRFSGSQQR